MITTSQMYWLTRLDSICIAEFIIAFIPTLIFFLWAAYRTFDFITDSPFSMSEQEINDLIVRLRLYAVVFITSMILWIPVCLTPSTRELAAIIIVPKIANNEKVQDCGNRLHELAIEWMKELKPNKEGNQWWKRL